MAFYACLRKGFQSGDYTAAKEEWLDECIPTLGEKSDLLFTPRLEILDYFKQNKIKVEESLLGPWIYVFQAAVRLADKKKIFYCLEVLKMKRAIEALKKKDQALVYGWLEEENVFKWDKKMKVLAIETAKIGHWEILESLLKKGASLNPSLFENKEETLLMTAAKFQHKELVITLLKRGAKAFFSGIGNEAIFKEYKKSNDYEKMADFLLEYGGQFQKKEQEKESMLLYGLINGQSGVEAAYRILKKYPLLSIDAKNSNGVSIMEEAVLRNDKNRAARASFFGASLSQRVKDGRSLLEWALVHDREWIFSCFSKEEIIEEGKKFKGGVLNQAINCLAFRSAKWLIANQIGLDDEDEQGRNPLMNAFRVSPALVQPLLEMFPDLEQRDLTGQHLLFYAIRSKESHLLGLLLKKIEHLINTPDHQGNTPLSQAVLMGQQQMVKQLVDYGADLFYKNNKGEDVYAIAMKEGDALMAYMIKELVKNHRGMKSIFRSGPAKKIQLPKKKVTVWSSISSARQNGN